MMLKVFMKHSFKVTGLLLTLFVVSQVIGIVLLNATIDVEKSAQKGKTEFKDLAFGERPPLEEETSYVPIMITIIIGTILVLLLIRFKLLWIWRIWFTFAVVFSLTIVLAVLVPVVWALAMALIFGIWKVFFPHFWVHNITEVLIYPGIALIFVPLLNLFSVSVLFVLISLYDAYAVWKSKHMVKLAQSQAESKMFAGLLIPYNFKISRVKSRAVKSSPITPSADMRGKVQTAMLGGGDIGFPLLFAGTVLKEIGLWQSFVIAGFATASLAFLFWIGKKEKFYPAMPFLAVGCFMGLAVVLVVMQFML